MKRMLSCIFTLAFVVSLTIPYVAAASSMSTEDTMSTLLIPYVQVTTENSEEQLAYTVKSASVQNVDENKYIASYEVFVPFPDLGIKPLSSIFTGKEDNGILAELKVTYFYNETTGDIKLSNVSGGWSGSISAVELKNQVVGITDGVMFGSKDKTWRPTTDTFSYDTGWGYVTCTPADIMAGTGPRAYSDTDYRIPGMGGWDWHHIAVFLAVDPTNKT